MLPDSAVVRRVPRTFDSGFSLNLMLKDMRIALGLAEEAGTPAALAAAATGLWAQAAGALPDGADHTEIAGWLDPGRFPRPLRAAEQRVGLVPVRGGAQVDHGRGLPAAGSLVISSARYRRRC